MLILTLDPNDIESPRTSFIIPNKLGLGQASPPVMPNAEELSLILGNMQVTFLQLICISIKFPLFT